MTDDDKGKTVEQPAPEQSPDNIPSPEETSTEVTPVGRRTGMFGVTGSGDTTGYGGLVKPTLYPAPAQAPYGGWFDVVAQGLDGLIESVVIHRKEITFHIARENLVEAARRLRDDETLRFEFCAGVSGVHYPDDTGRELHAVYHLLSMTHNRRVRVEVTCPDADPHIPSPLAHRQSSQRITTHSITRTTRGAEAPHHHRGPPVPVVVRKSR